jgi:type III secretory pathway component EscT
MPQEASKQVDPGAVRNSCIILIETLATNARENNQIVLALRNLPVGTILAMYCIVQFWAIEEVGATIGSDRLNRNIQRTQKSIQQRRDN